MRYFEFLNLIRGAAIAAALTIAGVSVPHVLGAQEAGRPDYVQEADIDDDGQEWGWLGLLGLAGLLGLRRRDREVHRVDTTSTRRP
jgi:MYXO-CTERM domain-containing protein